MRGRLDPASVLVGLFAVLVMVMWADYSTTPTACADWRSSAPRSLEQSPVVASRTAARASASPSATVATPSPARGSTGGRPAPVAQGGWRTIRATWYGPGLYGNRTACGQTYTRYLVGLASNVLRCGTILELRYHGVTIRVPVVDRHGHSAVDFFDLTDQAARLLGHRFSGILQWRLVR